MRVRQVTVIDDYEKADRDNIKKFRDRELYDNDRYAYQCVICGKRTTFDGSLSDEGHNLVCILCARHKFAGGELAALDWATKKEERL